MTETSPTSSTVTSRPPEPPSAGLSDRHKQMLRLACRGFDPWGVVNMLSPPKHQRQGLYVEAALLLSLHCERISALRRVWHQHKRGTPS